jgi:anionic cell wall polymer biosynthesis LytR-Cps2A-Psr (LCP) family protein
MRFARLRVVLILLGVVAVLAGAYVIASRIEDSQYVEPRGGIVTESTLQTREYQGRTYVRKSGLHTLLVIGVDDTEEDAAGYVGYRNNSQADFLLLIVVDATDRQVHRLLINRNTMAEIVVLGILGREIGTQKAQITLAHGFGKTEEERSKHTVQAVQNLLEGETIDHYVSFLMDSMQKLNHAVGGVEITLEDDDLAVLDPTMVKGAHLTLTDDQAALLIRSRMLVGDGLNASRMNRQRMFLDALVQTVRKKGNKDVSFVNRLSDDLYAMCTTDANRATLNNLFNLSFSYDILPVETLAGEYTYGSDGFEEFYTDESAIISWVLETLYRPQT